jgi:hypothetical protein
MKSNLIKYAIFTIIVLILGLRFVIGAETILIKHEYQTKTLYIDPWYGGIESGPCFGKNKYGKAITLEIAHKTQRLLEVAGFKVYLSRDVGSRPLPDLPSCVLTGA